MTALLKITKTEGAVTILHLEGHLDGKTENDFIERARITVNNGARFLLLDLGGVDMITSAGLRALHSIYKMCNSQIDAEEWRKSHEGKTYRSPHFKLAAASSQVEHILGISGFLQNISMYTTLQEAIDSFAE